MGTLNFKGRQIHLPCDLVAYIEELRVEKELKQLVSQELNDFIETLVLKEGKGVSSEVLDELEVISEKYLEKRLDKC